MSSPEAEPRWDAPEVGVRTFRALLVFFERQYGRARLEQLWKEAALPLPLAVVEDLSGFVSLAFGDRLLDALVEGSGNPRFLQDAGRFAAGPEALGFAYYMLRGLGTPRLIYQKVVELGPTYNRVGRFAIERISDVELVLTYKSQMPERNRNGCLTRQATFAAMPGIWGLPDAEVKETQCQVLGADCCRYELSWQRRPPVTWRRFVGGVVGLALGVPVVMAAAAAPWVPAIFSAGGFFLGAWLDQLRVAEAKDAILKQQTDGMSMSIEELTRRADEVFRANVELDQRVADRTRELNEALQRLRELDQLKNEFFANVSHELRTPLTLILAPVEERLSTALAREELTLLEGIRRNARRLLRFIDDLLDLSRIDAGHLRLDIVSFDATTLVEQVVSGFRLAAEAAGVELRVEGPKSANNLWGDLHRLESVVGNLLGNALKFTPPGGRVTVKVEEGAHETSLTVTDTGPGIAAHDLTRIFERFFQAEGERSQRRGVGIGLSLAKNLVELHGGRLTVTSTPGEGASFTVVLRRGRDHFAPGVLERRRVQVEVKEARRAADAHRTPVTPVPEPPVARAEAPVSFDGRRARVLVVEDNVELRQLFRDLLSGTHDVLLAGDGERGLEAVRKERPDLVLSDVMMPGLSGTSLCAAIKADPALASTPVVLITARSGADAALEGYAAGADEFIEKPFHPRVLLARVQAQLRLRALGLQVATQARLAAVGTLAAGVGHEVRNPVNAVLNGARVLAEHATDPDARRLVDVVIDAARRIDHISRALLDHASPGDRGGARPIDVKAGLEATVRLLQHRFTETQLHLALQPDVRVVAPAVELNQAFLNLLDNALMAKARNVWVTMTTTDRTARVVVDDDGPGVPPDVAARLFDPFFTTKAPGEGTGLGLYLSRQSVHRCGGTLTYAPRPGGGARFELELPRELV
ncbi:MAG: response regulator [Myxococcaceae bacterium]|nr:response regulator [Myxococcaceae bacterium]